MAKRTRLSRPLTVLVPVLVGVVLIVLVHVVLVHVAFETARGVAVETQQRDIEELVELAGSAIERL